MFSLADPFFLVLPVCFWLAFLALERQRPSLVGRTAWLDVAALVVSVGAYLWYFLLAAQLLNSSNSLFCTIVTAAYPLSDLLLLTFPLARARSSGGTGPIGTGHWLWSWAALSPPIWATVS